MFMNVQVKFVRTIVGWYNVYLVDYPSVKPVNLSPDQFAEIFPATSSKARLGCDEMDKSFAESLFGTLQAA